MKLCRNPSVVFLVGGVIAAGEGHHGEENRKARERHLRPVLDGRFR